MSGRSIQIIEGEWYSLGHFELSECCDCGLVHREEFKLEKDGRIWFRTRVDARATRAARKARGISPPRKG